MLSEIISLLIRGAYEVFLNTADGFYAGAQYFMRSVYVFREQAATASPLETLAVIGIFGTGGYLLYEYFWDSAKEVVIIVAVIFVLFFVAAFVV